jgi:hypothetical protein
MKYKFCLLLFPLILYHTSIDIGSENGRHAKVKPINKITKRQLEQAYIYTNHGNINTSNLYKINHDIKEQDGEEGK